MPDGCWNVKANLVLGPPVPFDVGVELYEQLRAALCS